MKRIPAAYLASYLLSLLGNSVASIALPLIVLQTTGSVLGTGVVAAATAVPAVLAGLFMGVVIDRINRRTSSVLTDLVSAATIAALPVVDLVTGLSLGWFVLFGVLGSLGDVPGMTAREALLPRVVAHSGMSTERLVGLRETLGAVAMLTGPAAAGTLMVLLDGPTVLWITAATSLAAALTTLLIPRSVGEVAPDVTVGTTGTTTDRPSTGWAQLREGWQVLFGNRFLLAVTLLSLVSVLVLAALQGLVLPVWFTLVERPGMLGFVLSALALGLLVGGAVYAVAGARVPRRAWFMAGLAGTTLGLLVIATLTSVWLVLLGAVVLGAASGLVGSLMGVLMVERIPEHVRGRVMGTQNALMTVAAPVGIVVAALLTELSGARTAALTLAGLWLVLSAAALRARSLRDLGAPPLEQADPDGGRMVDHEQR